MLTSQQRDEIDRVLLKASGPILRLKIISEDKEDTTSDLLDYMLVSIIERTLGSQRKHYGNTLNYGKSSATPVKRARSLTSLTSSLETQKCFKYPKLAISCGRLKSHLRPYVGKAVDGFYEYLENNDTKFTGSMHRPYYAKFCSIVQSSGTRLMTELRNKGVIVLYMNLRDPSDLGFPMGPCDLGLVTRTHASDSIQCLSNLSYINGIQSQNIKVLKRF
ncbi:hypothetical protein EV424DRAFT_1349476 [Suillus variegatus]|nr:hypothetical protein EV424DRAFT_1349476 [Suillus variegatus]